MHFTKQAVAVRVRVKEKNSKPAIIAAITLAVAISIVKSIIEKSIVPNIPVRSTERARQRQVGESSLRQPCVESRVTARKATAMPKNTQSNGVPTASVPVKVRNAAATPTMALTITAIRVQLILH